MIKTINFNALIYLITLLCISNNAHANNTNNSLKTSNLPKNNNCIKVKRVNAFSDNTTKESAHLIVYANDKILINHDIFGINNDWRQISNEVFPNFIKTFKHMNCGIMRFPGGWESEHYNWENNTTPTWKKSPNVPGVSLSKLKAHVSNYSIVVPTKTALDKPYNSTDWKLAVEKLKERAVDAINKADANNIKYLEIGNEWWLQYAGGVKREEKLLNYSKAAMKIAGHIDSLFSNRKFKILVNGDYTVPEEFTTMKQHFTEHYNTIDGLALHTYTGYNTSTHNIKDLEQKMNACINNFNSSGNMLIYASEWMASRDYNNKGLYMEAANVIPAILHIYARNNVKAAAYWPPVNNSAPGVGLVNWNGNKILPCGQILRDMAKSYFGYALKTVSDKISIVAALQNNNSIVFYIMGKDHETTNVSINVLNFTIENISTAKKFIPADYNNTKKAAPYITDSASINLKTPNQLNFVINEKGKFEIFKIELKGKSIQ